MNIASDMMLEEQTGNKRQQLLSEITGPFRTMGTTFQDDPDLLYAPSWWHGEDEAYAASEAVMLTLPKRGRARRR